MEAKRSRILVVSLILFIAGSALTWDQVYRTATAAGREPPASDAEMMIESGGRLVASPPPRRLPHKAPAKRVRPVPPIPVDETRTVKVQPGDSLYRVAKRALGRGSRWKEIATMNDVAPPYHIHPGQTLELPAR